MNQVVSQEQWTEARKQFLLKEKELTKAVDELNAQRRKLPWVKVDKEYVFDTPQGKKTLAQLFDGRSQLVVYHFMLAPAAMSDASDARSFPITSTAPICIYSITM